MVQRGLAKKFSLAIALVVIVSVGAMSLLAISMSRQSLRNQALAANLTAATLAARAVEQYVADAASIMREAPGRPKLNREIRTGNWPEVTKVLENFLRHFPQFDYVFVQDPQGVIRVRVPYAPTVGQNFAFRDFFQDVTRTRTLRISDAYISRAAQRTVVSIAVPVLEGGDTVKGVLVGALSLTTMSEVVSAVGTDDGAQLVLVDRGGVLIARSKAARVDVGRDLTALPIVQAVLAGKTGTLEFTGSIGNGRLLGAHVPIPQLGWGIVATRPTSVAFAPADQLARWLLGIAVACAALAVAVGWRLARVLTNPLARLSAATDRLAAGEFDVRVNADGRDEVAALAVSFNHMTEHLQAAYETLERKTKQVEAINQELVGEIAERRRSEEEISRLNQALRDQLEELHRTQAQLVQSEKIATMGSLLAGVAHELNNPLAVAMGQAMLLRESASEPALLRRADKIHTAAERCARIVKNFLALARNRPPERGPVELNRVVRDAVELLAYELRTSSVEVNLRLDESLSTVMADAHQLHQVVVNLVTNAHYAMRKAEGRRALTITTSADSSGGRVRVAVADTGPGIPADVRSRIFEPFFTTKPPGEGTGLGLSLCRTIVDEHGGRLTVDSEPGQGATFVVDLPAVPAGEPSAVAVEQLVPLSPKTILVVDDEPEIAATLAETLERDGHKVDVAADGIEALTRLGAQSYDLIFCDTKMPHLDGVMLYQEIARRFPGLQQRVIFVTGDVIDQEKQAFLQTTGRLAIMKPFDLGEVRRAVRRVLVGPA